MNRHISEQFDAELEQVRLRMMEMGGLVTRQLEASIQAFVSHDPAAASEVLGNEQEVNRLELVIDDQCVRTIALRQPAARDLRFLISIMKAGTDLERAGDETARIARLTDRLALLMPMADGYADLAQMGELVACLLRDSLDAFARMSADLAYEVIAADAQVDALYSRVASDLTDFAKAQPMEIERSIASVWVARSLERIGDHAKNIGEHLVYLIDGVDVRHSGVGGS